MTEPLPACVIIFIANENPKLKAIVYWDGYTMEMLDAKLKRYVKTHYNNDASRLSVNYVHTASGELYRLDRPDTSLFTLRKELASRVYGNFFVEGVMCGIEITCEGCGTDECVVDRDMYDEGGGDLLAGNNIMTLEELKALEPSAIPVVDEDDDDDGFLEMLQQARDWLDDIDEHLGWWE